MTNAPTWYMDGQLGFARQRMAQAHAVLQRVQDEIPPGYVQPGTPEDSRLQAARRQAWEAEHVFAERFMELDASGG